MVANGLYALWRYRGLLRQLVRRDLRLKYKGSVVGFGWSMLHPLLLVAVYSLAFRLVLRVGVEDFPFFLLSGLLPWTFHSSALAAATSSVVDAGHLVRKVDFPRAALPLGVVLTQWAQFLLMYAVAVVAIGAFGVGFSPTMLAAIPLAGLQLVFAVGLGLMLCTAHVYLRDVRHLVDVAVQLWFWATPIVYPIAMVPATLAPAVQANPMTLFVTAYQDALVHHVAIDPSRWLAMTAVASVALALGVATFQRFARRFAELV